LSLVLTVVAASCPTGRIEAATVTDMAGKTVTVPDAPKKVYALSPPDSLLVYAVAPCLLAGWNAPQTKAPADWLPPCARNLPVLGGAFGQGLTPNKEALLLAHPDLVISGFMVKVNDEIEDFFQAIGIPVVHIESKALESYPESLRFLGKLLGNEERGQLLADYAQSTMEAIRQGVAAIPQDKRLTVYYAESDDGLSTDGKGSFHTQVLEMAGGNNVHRTPQTRMTGMDKVSLETVLGYAPQVIITQHRACRDMILSSPTWREIPAVRDGRVLAIPAAPANWFDRPPSFMRLLGLKWLAHALYPDTFPYDMVKETREFIKLFWDKDISEAQARRLLGQDEASRP
jgi:iron complex transport system substrate-binding protein